MLNITDSIRTILANQGYAVNAGMNLEQMFSAAALQLAATGVSAVPFWIFKTFADGASGDTIVTAPCPAQFRVIDFMFENRGTNGANANTVQLCAAASGASPISDALSTNNVANKGIVRAAVLDVATAVIAAAGNLYIARTRAGGALTGEARILCVPA